MRSTLERSLIHNFITPLLTTSRFRDGRETTATRRSYKSKLDDHSKLVPPLPIPNRTVKQLCADDSAATSVKVGYRQASYIKKPLPVIRSGLFFAYALTKNVLLYSL